MSTKTWLCWECGLFYEIARDRPEILYFDERCWNHYEIVEFFNELRYGDYEAYAQVIRWFPEYKITDFKTLIKNNSQAERRYNKWVKQHPHLCEWR